MYKMGLVVYLLECSLLFYLFLLTSITKVVNNYCYPRILRQVGLTHCSKDP